MLQAQLLRDPNTYEELKLEGTGAVNPANGRQYPWKHGYLAFMEEADAAERLPFQDNSFDSVYHVGGINVFSDPHAAVLEMIRVAKPGTRLMIADETHKLVKGTYGKVPVVKGYFAEGADLPEMLGLIPPEMLEVVYKEVCKGLMYCITFRKP
ncbi:class I SAM-dependent methyltransferase [Paenibacillus sp. FSL R7-0179]|uniref:class I SAM-dependent methyltransferase n=1 Tax=Paenibacillus sp. FSL R7-0179 TaxID=2921672 RepID=UPI0030F526AE